MGIDPDDTDAAVRMGTAQSGDRAGGGGVIPGQHHRKQAPLPAAGDQLGRLSHHPGNLADVTGMGGAVASPDLAGAGPGLLLLADLFDQLIANAAQILLPLGRLLEQLDARTGPGDAGAEIAIHLHQSDLRGTAAAVVMNQRFLEALEISQGDGQLAITEQQIQEFVIGDRAAAIGVMGRHQGRQTLGIEMLRFEALLEDRQHHGHLLQAEAAAAIAVDQIEDRAQVAAEIEAALTHRPDGEVVQIKMAIPTGHRQQRGALLGGDDVAEVGQGPLRFPGGNPAIAIGIEQPEEQFQLPALQHGLG